MKDKYTFRREVTDIYDNTSVVEHTVEGETLDEVVESFLYFLNGCSFSYVKDLIFVKENGSEQGVTDYQVDEPRTADDLNQLIIDLEDTITLTGMDDNITLD